MKKRIIILFLLMLYGTADASMWGGSWKDGGGTKLALQPRNTDTVAISGDWCGIWPEPEIANGTGPWYSNLYGFGRSGGAEHHNSLSFDTAKSINVNTPITAWKLRVKEKPAQLTSLKIRTIPFAAETGGTQFMPKNYDSGELKDITPSAGSWTDDWVTLPATGTGTAQIGDLINIVSTCSATGNPYIYCNKYAAVDNADGGFRGAHRFNLAAVAAWADPTNWKPSATIYAYPNPGFAIYTEVAPVVQALGQAPLITVFGDSIPLGAQVGSAPGTYNFAIPAHKTVVDEIDAPYDSDYDIAHHIAAVLGGVTHSNMSVAGMQTVGAGGLAMENYLNTLIVAKKPKYVFLHLGANDISNSVSTEDYVTRYTAIFDKLEPLGITCIVSPMFAFDTTQGVDAKVTQRNEARAALAAYIATRPSVLYVDARAAVEVGGYTIDGTHLNKAALIRWGVEAGRQIHALLSRNGASYWAKGW